MRLEGTLDAFSLPDIFQLLSYTKKTGTLHLRRDSDSEGVRKHGIVHLKDGAVTGGRGDATSQALGRRMVGTGLVSDEDLAEAVSLLVDEPTSGLGRALAERGSLSSVDAKRLGAEQATDAVFELLRWEQGEFAFVVDEPDPDDVGCTLVVEDVVAEGRRRLDIWNDLITKVPSVDAPVMIAASPEGEAALSREEWALLSLVDGHRTVAELVNLSGTGEYVVVSALVALADRGLVVVAERSEGEDALTKRHALLNALEGKEQPTGKRVKKLVPVVEEPVAVVEEPIVELVEEDVEEDVEDEVVEEPAAEVEDAPSVPEIIAPRAPVIPERPEPFTPERQPDFAEEPVPALARLSASSSAAPSSAPVMASASPASSVGSVQGAHALKPETSPAPSHLIDRDPSVNKSLLLRLIAGVRGL
jgi:hypothetical protein